MNYLLDFEKIDLATRRLEHVRQLLTLISNFLKRSRKKKEVELDSLLLYLFYCIIMARPRHMVLDVKLLYMCLSKDDEIRILGNLATQLLASLQFLSNYISELCREVREVNSGIYDSGKVAGLRRGYGLRVDEEEVDVQVVGDILGLLDLGEGSDGGCASGEDSKQGEVKNESDCKEEGVDNVSKEDEISGSQSEANSIQSDQKNTSKNIPQTKTKENLTDTLKKSKADPKPQILPDHRQSKSINTESNKDTQSLTKSEPKNDPNDPHSASIEHIKKHAIVPNQSSQLQDVFNNALSSEEYETTEEDEWEIEKRNQKLRKFFVCNNGKKSRICWPRFTGTR